MQWTKVKTKHFLFSDYTLAERGALITLLLLTAHLERIPHEREMVRHTSKHTLSSVRDKLEQCSTDLREVLGKVLEDVAKTTGAKKLSSETSQTYRNKGKSDVSRDEMRDVARIEENRVEENRVESKYIVEIINHLNMVCDVNYKTNTQKTKELINARVKEGFTVANFKEVIEKQFANWGNTERNIYLRPETLFSNKFEGYLNAKKGVNNELSKSEKERRQRAINCGLIES